MEQQSQNQSQGSGVAAGGGATMWKDLFGKIRKPCLSASLDLQMQVHPDYDTAPDGGSTSGNGQKGGQTPICDKSETITVKWRIADMVAVGMLTSVAISLLCGVKHLCCFMKK